MATARTIDVQEFVNAHPVSRSQRWVIAFCFLVVAIDGFDTAAVGFIAPALRAAWGLAPAQLVPLFGAGLFGLMIGAFVFGPLADKVGRKPVLVLTTLFFGVATVVSTFATSIEMLTILRFVTGLGLGGAMPAAITLTSEFCPEQRRSLPPHGCLGQIISGGFPRKEMCHGPRQERWRAAGRRGATARVWRGGARTRWQDVATTQDGGSAAAAAW